MPDNDTIIQKVKRNDGQPYAYFQFKDDQGTGVNLTGATIVATMKNTSDDTLKINRQSAGIAFDGTASGSDADDITVGKGHYEWQSGDTDTSGTYLMEFEATPSSGGKFTLPVKETFYIIISDDLDNT